MMLTSNIHIDKEAPKKYEQTRNIIQSFKETALFHTKNTKYRVFQKELYNFESI